MMPMLIVMMIYVWVLIDQPTNGGRYVCVAENAAARTSKELLLRVQGQFNDSDLHSLRKLEFYYV